jgi:23S rRNA (pseudouridine1915-N3)-methyltransferase
VKILLAAVMGRNPANGLAEAYLERTAQYTQADARVYRSEAALLEAVERLRSRTTPVLVLLDGRGKMLSSEGFADWIGRQRDGGVQQLVFAIGPANGWSDDARKQARMLLSLGAMTLPHELARVVISEQVYRAFTILAGHPYHSGH